jgi:hypothetical protein
LNSASSNSSIQFPGVYRIYAVEPILPELGISGLTPIVRTERNSAGSTEHFASNPISAKSTCESGHRRFNEATSGSPRPASCAQSLGLAFYRTRRPELPRPECAIEGRSDVRRNSKFEDRKVEIGRTRSWTRKLSTSELLPSTFGRF